MLRRSILANSKRYLSSQSSNYKPDLKNLELRWPKMKELDQADVLDYLNQQSKLNWNQLDTDEKKALYYIYFGEYGPRSKDKKPVSIAGILLNGWFYGFLIGAVGVSYYNWEKDNEHEKEYNRLITEVEQLKKELVIKEEKEQSGKSWWRLWG